MGRPARKPGWTYVPPTPIERARALYVDGQIDIHELEQRIEKALQKERA